MKNAANRVSRRAKASIVPLMMLVVSLVGCLSIPQTGRPALTPSSPIRATPNVGDGSEVPTVQTPGPTSSSVSGETTVASSTQTIDPNRQAYYDYATQVAASGGMTLVPYETAVSVETAYQLELTSFAESLFTPTPFGPLPFPGTRLTDAELEERGWPRMGPGGIRNEDYHTTAIWLDKDYVDAEIFSKYEALFDLLAFRDGPPGQDFEARLGELMLPDEPEDSMLNLALLDNARDRGLLSCTSSAIADGVAALKQTGAYVRVLDAAFGFQIVWEFIEDQPAPFGTYNDKVIAFQIEDHYIVLIRTALQDPAKTRSLNGLTFDVEKVSIATGEVLQKWVATFEVTHSNETFMAVWSPEINDWRILKFESPYCADYFPESLEP